MRIKQLELFGFKSFVDRTVLNFSAGVSGIVGPNGCGKSNIVDSIRWVLGEQSPKHLRGSAMEDVIFNGNERRAPLGMAEVSLTFENEPQAGSLELLDPDLDVSAVPAHVRSLAEITVTRRYFRSGESEYFINRAPCRLKDITELFLGTGVGSKAYAIIEQGRVEQLINAKPEDRRLFIEEAAGTTLYRSRKLAAERKMERTRENLLRVNDILREVERQVQYLNRQAKKAEQYRTLQAEARSLELAMARAQWRHLDAEVAALSESLAELGREEDQSLLQLSEAEAERGRARTRATESEHRLGALRESAARASAELEAGRQRTARLRQEIADREQRLQRLQEEIAALAARAEALAGDGEQIAEEQRRYAERIAAEETELQLRAAAVEEQRHAEAAAVARAEASKDRLVGLLAEEADLRNQLSALQRRGEELRRRLERLAGEATEAAAQLGAVEQGLGGQRQLLADLQQRLRQLEGEREAGSQRLQQIVAEKRRAQEQVAAAQEEVVQLRSRLQSLEEIQRNYEGYQRGVRAVMLRQGEESREMGADIAVGGDLQLARSSGGPVETGILGVVADVISAPREYERAVAAVLGERLQYVIVSGAEQAMDAVQLLRAEDSGRSSFIPLSPRRISLNGHSSAPSLSARLLDLVEVQDGYREVAEMLLGDVLVVPDMKTALALWRRNGTHVTMVTPEGDVLDAYGVVTGGSDRPIEEQILGRRREIHDLEVSVTSGAAAVKCAATAAAELEADEARESEALRRLDAGVHELTLAVLAAQKDCERLEAERPRCVQRIDVVRLESDNGAREVTEVDAEIAQLRQRLAAAEAERLAVEGDLQVRQSESAALKTAAAAALEELTGVRVRVAESRERQLALASRADEIARQRHEIGERADRLRIEDGELAQRREGLLAEIESGEAALAGDEERVRELGAEIAEAVAEVEVAEQAAAQQDRQVDDLRQRIDAGRSERVGKETALAERRIRREHLEQSMREKHEVDLPAEAAGGDEEVDPDAAARLEQLRQKLIRIGEVNVSAIDELKELEERAEFLRTQKDDLERSLADLEQTIGKLNRASKARFQETFAKADEKFRTVLPRLFRGGEARLVLTNENNILESGVEIFVRPPGKKLDTVTLLSGGEKALVAVSLIFSLFLISPTPFCFLDEIDAPLDDANVGRFVQMVREMREQSQFILITHNKRTMEAADCLYGVTMEEPGVSTVISVAMR